MSSYDDLKNRVKRNLLFIPVVIDLKSNLYPDNWNRQYSNPEVVKDGRCVIYYIDYIDGEVKACSILLDTWTWTYSDNQDDIDSFIREHFIVETT